MGISMTVDLSSGLKGRDAVSMLSASESERRGVLTHTYTQAQPNAKWGPMQSMRRSSTIVNKEEEEAGRREGGSGSEGGWWRERRFKLAHNRPRRAIKRCKEQFVNLQKNNNALQEWVSRVFFNHFLKAENALIVEHYTTQCKSCNRCTKTTL